MLKLKKKKKKKLEKAVVKKAKAKRYCIIQKFKVTVLRAVQCNSDGKLLKNGGIIRVDETGGGKKYLKGYLNGSYKILKWVKLSKPVDHT